MKKFLRWLETSFFQPKNISAKNQSENLLSPKPDNIDSSNDAEEIGRLDGQALVEIVSMPDSYSDKHAAAAPTASNPTSADGEVQEIDDGMYQVGYALGKQWAGRDATPDQLMLFENLGAGKDWISTHDEPAKELTRIIDPNKSSLVGTGENPSASFVAGFIDGARAFIVNQ